MSITKEKILNIVYNVIKFSALLLGGFVITKWVVFKVPFDGLELLGVGSCGFPSGLPFSFMGTWKHALGEGPLSACALGFDRLAFVLNIIFWAVPFYLILLLLEKLSIYLSIKLEKYITLDKGRFVAVFIIVVLLLFFLFLYLNVNAQSVSFDLENLRNQDVNLTKAYDTIGIQEAWEKILVSIASTSSVIVGIVDTGVDVNHQEFNAPGVNLGRFVLVDFDPGGHGTQVSGIIGANNISAITPLPVDSPQINGILSGILTENEYTLEVRPGISTLLSLAANLESVINSNSQVINMSFGISLCDFLSEDQKRLVENRCIKSTGEFISKKAAYSEIFISNPDILFIAAAGNFGLPISNVLPAGVSTQNILVVGATDLLDSRAIFSSFESSNFNSDISAPGVGVYAPKPSGGYDPNFSGTSASAPLVTGVAALLKALEPEYQKHTPGLVMTPAKIKEILQISADPITTDKPLGSGCFTAEKSPGTGYNGCRLNAHRAVVWLLPPTPVILNALVVTPVP